MVDRIVPHLLREPELATPRCTFSLTAIAGEQFVGFVAIGPVTDERQPEFGRYLRLDAWLAVMRPTPHDALNPRFP